MVCANRTWHKAWLAPGLNSNLVGILPIVPVVGAVPHRSPVDAAATALHAGDAAGAAEADAAGAAGWCGGLWGCACAHWHPCHLVNSEVVPGTVGGCNAGDLGAVSVCLVVVNGDLVGGGGRGWKWRRYENTRGEKAFKGTAGWLLMMRRYLCRLAIW
jgi:hypothetical protein